MLKMVENLNLRFSFIFSLNLNGYHSDALVLYVFILCQFGQRSLVSHLSQYPLWHWHLCPSIVDPIIDTTGKSTLSCTCVFWKTDGKYLHCLILFWGLCICRSAVFLRKDCFINEWFIYVWMNPSPLLPFLFLTCYLWSTSSFFSLSFKTNIRFDRYWVVWLFLSWFLFPFFLLYYILFSYSMLNRYFTWDQICLIWVSLHLTDFPPALMQWDNFKCLFFYVSLYTSMYVDLKANRQELKGTKLLF